MGRVYGVCNKSLACMKYQIGEYEVSLSADDSLQEDGNIRRGTIRIFKGEEDVTQYAFPDSDCENDGSVYNDDKNAFIAFKFASKNTVE